MSVLRKERAIKRILAISILLSLSSLFMLSCASSRTKTIGNKVKELVDGIKAANFPLRRPPDGYILFAPGGDQVGVMYATRMPTSDTVIRLKDGNLIAVTPHNDAGFAPGP